MTDPSTDPFAPPSGDPQPPVYGAPPPPPPYAAPQYGAPVYGGPVASPQRNGFGVTALVLGILSIVTSFTIGGGIVLGILGLVFGILGYRRSKRGEASNGGLALAGAITGGIGLLVGAGVLIFILTNGDTQNYIKCVADAGSDPAAKVACETKYRQDLTN